MKCEELTDEYSIFVRQHRLAGRSDVVSDGAKKAARLLLLRPQPPQTLQKHCLVCVCALVASSMCSRHTKQRQYAKECFVVAQRVFLLTGEVSPKRVFFFLNNDLRGFFVARNEGKKKNNNNNNNKTYSCYCLLYKQILVALDCRLV